MINVICMKWLKTYNLFRIITSVHITVLTALRTVTWDCRNVSNWLRKTVKWWRTFRSEWIRQTVSGTWWLMGINHTETLTVSDFAEAAHKHYHKQDYDHGSVKRIIIQKLLPSTCKKSWKKRRDKKETTLLSNINTGQRREKHCCH